MENELIIKLMHTQLICQLKEYEKMKQASCKSFSLSESASFKFDSILYFLNEINSKIDEKTLETVFFKHQIGNLSMNEIVCGIFIR